MSAIKTAAPNREPLWDIVEESRDEAAFLWRRWEAELTSLTRNLDEVWSWTEDRLHGALDGAAVGGDATIERLLIPALTHEELSYNTVAAYLLVNSRSDKARDALSTALRDAKGAKLSAMIRGIEVTELSGRFAPIAAMLAKHSPEHCAALCRLKVFHRATLGQELRDTFSSNIPELQAFALQAAAHLPAQYVNSWIDTGLKSDHLSVRQAAMLSGIRCRVPQAWSAALNMARESLPESSSLLLALALFGGVAEHQVVTSAIKLPTTSKAAVRALAHIGTPEAIQLLLELMSDAQLARVAGEAYCAIAGVELERDRLMQADLPDEAPTFEADDLNANLVPQQDETWPLPDVAAVTRHWDSVRARFSRGVRYLRGAPANLQRLAEMVEKGPMLRRADHVFELAARTSGQYDVVERAFAATQRRMMSAARARIGS